MGNKWEIFNVNMLSIKHYYCKGNILSCLRENFGGAGLLSDTADKTI